MTDITPFIREAFWGGLIPRLLIGFFSGILAVLGVQRLLWWLDMRERGWR